MPNNIRPVIAFVMASVGCVATALLALPAAAGMNSWTPIGPVGVILGPPFAVDPSSPNTIYSVANGDTVTKTTDGGANWTDLPGDYSLLISSLMIDPTSAATIYVAGEQRADFEIPIYRSFDGGAHWAEASKGVESIDATLLAIAPSLNTTLYVLGDQGVVKSTDGGASWVQVDGLTGYYVSAVAINQKNADAVYAAAYLSPASPDAEATIFKSINGGAQWRQVPISVPAGAQITSLAIDPATPSIVYAAYAPLCCQAGGPVSGGIFKSIDSGETWIAMQNGPETTGVMALAIDPSAPARIYAATQNGVFMSTDAATSWTPINSGLANLNTLAISIDRSGSILRVASYEGLFEYTVSGSTTMALIEYFHAAFDDYFITASPDEIRTLDSGAFPGWARTGFQFNAYPALQVPAVSVCRFFSTGFAPKSTHFYTPFSSECAALRLDPNWELESASAFAMALPDTDGVCAPGLIPVYRFYNLSQGGVPNHRYTIDAAVRAQMMAQGWVAEGLGPNAVEMCSPM